ncbi:MAG: xanthine dehydrogenase family protein subunit M [Candidimonas sp.]|nr:xanthine dehydrogenase family protein subunit M [Candidimonas sp.]
MIPRPFEYHAPQSLPEAINLLTEYGDEAKLLAGGHSLLPMMKLRFAQPGHLIDLGKIPGLKGISEVGNEIRIGSMTTENELIWSEVLQRKCPLLVEGARLISDPQVRYMGTIGGDIAHGDPGNDHPALMLALDASFVLQGPSGERVVAAADFFLGTYYTALVPNEILTEIRIPTPDARTGQCYSKLKRKVGDFATAASAVLLRMDGTSVDYVSIALTNLGPVAFKASEAESFLLGKELNEQTIQQACQLTMSACDPVADLRGDVKYKMAMAGVMTDRALRTAHSRATR